MSDIQIAPTNTAVQPIKGYRQLSPAEAAIINDVKDIAELVGQTVDKLAELPDIDIRWLSIARTDLQKGFMTLVRAIARPATF